MKLIINNRSLWPDWWVRPIAQWIAHRAGIYDLKQRQYTLTIAKVARPTMLAGRGGRNGSRVRIPRRFQPTGGFPYTTRYWKYKWSFQYQLNNRLEAFVDIVSHEMCHATAGDPAKFYVGGKIDRAAMEMVCERFSKETVDAFRKESKELMRRVMQAARADRQNRQKAKKGPDVKLDKAQRQLALWQRKAKTAATKIKKYKAQVKYYEGRVAAKSNGQTRTDGSQAG